MINSHPASVCSALLLESHAIMTVTKVLSHNPGFSYYSGILPRQLYGGYTGVIRGQ